MTQDERWNIKYQEVVEFIEFNKRNPSRHNPEERGCYCNWIHHNKKLMNSGKLRADRIEKFNELLALVEEYKRVNQYK